MPRQREPARLAAAALIMLLAACSRRPAAAPPTPAPPPGATPAAGGCGSTASYQGAIPAWLVDATANNAPGGLPFVPANPPDAAAFLFARPLRAGHPQNPANKILWVVRGDRQGRPLQIDGHPLGTASPAVHDSQPANSGPGSIYPSLIDVPSAGCWQFTLHWATGSAEIDLAYVTRGN